MFCYQCEQTNEAKGCTTMGVCGKTPETSALQDLLVHMLKGLGALAHIAHKEGFDYDPHIDLFINEAMFATVTNVNFDEARFGDYLTQTHLYQVMLREKLSMDDDNTQSEDSLDPVFGAVPNPVHWDLMAAAAYDPCLITFMDIGKQVGLAQRFKTLENATITGLQEFVTYGLKGTMAYMHHAEVMGYVDTQISDDIHQELHFLTTPEANDPDALLKHLLQVGEINLRVLALLDKAHTTKYGDPEPTEVSQVPVEGKCILVSGHDIPDLVAVLERTEDTGINVYTHGELLPAHSYPQIKKYPHFKGHYGGAWYKQKTEFHKFPGSILMTSNCILEPLSTYRDNIFTIGQVGVSSARHLADHAHLDPLIEQALALPGFTSSAVSNFACVPPLTVGFGHATVLGVAGEVLGAIDEGKLSHVFLIGGCDGNEPSRAYYKELASMLPRDTITLTLGCAKFRLLDQEWGNLPGTDLPRLLDMGQCNDAYSAVVVAKALAEALDTDINGLPLSLDISWFEQKAVAVLLTLLHLGVRNIRLGPRMPAFLTPEATAFLQEKFAITPATIGAADADLASMMKHH